MSNSTDNEPLPVDENIHVIKYTNVYKKPQRWWCAVVLADSFGHKKVMVYLWQWMEIKKREGNQLVSTGQYKWKRKQKMGINFRNNWEVMKQVIEQYLTEAGL